MPITASEDISGKVFGKWTVIKRTDVRVHSEIGWLCKCECGKTAIKGAYDLKTGHSKSCGCARSIKQTKHGLSKKHPIYPLWSSMRARCYNPKHVGYPRYGGRGISICDDWHDIKKFIAWAESHGYERGLSLDRIDNDGNYCPENCRWITKHDQNFNRSDNILIEYNGVIKTAIEWAREMGVWASTIRRRYARGIRGDEIFNIRPYHKRGST